MRGGEPGLLAVRYFGGRLAAKGDFDRRGVKAARQHGVDGLQWGGNVAVWFGLPYSLDLYEQANARLHRPGQENNVVVHHLVAIGTIDERIMGVLANKGNMQQALIDAVKELV